MVEALEKIPLPAEEIIQDYRTAYRSRQASLIGRREVLSGKAKFGIFGDGKELPQLAMARVFQNGDFRSGYYRDQTFMFAAGISTVREFFAQLYAHTDLELEPATGGRSMNAHFATRSLNADGSWKDLTAQKNVAADLSPTGSQLPRLVGLAYASKLYREIEALHSYTHFSHGGQEIAFGTVGNASCAEGLFWETINAIGVLRCPAILTVYDDGYGISVANEHQIAKENISELLMGFQRPPGECCDGFDIYTIRGWDYPGLIQAYRKAVQVARTEQMPSIIHVDQLTQPLGHSTSGSHERYKSKERLAWEAEFDCIRKFRQWMLAEGLITADALDRLEAEDRLWVESERKQAWEAYFHPIQQERESIAGLIRQAGNQSGLEGPLNEIQDKLRGLQVFYRRDILAAVRESLIVLRAADVPAKASLIAYRQEEEQNSYSRYSSHLYVEDEHSVLKVTEVKPSYSENSPSVYGYEILNACFDAALAREPRLLAFGEDVGVLGDVNQGMRGMQEKYGLLRVADTGIREATILGQAIGLALRGLRPIAEIQYLDYLLYALQLMSDDLASLYWRTKGGQKAPVIVRTRGHRLEGIWHSGSPMAGIINLVRGLHVLVPRDMTRAAGFYNTLLQAEEPALVIEVLNGYRIKERLPENIAELRVPLGTPEVLRPGSDLTVVTYGACCRIALEAAEALSRVGVEVEIIDVQTLLPFDRPGLIHESLKKTSRILILDEDVPGGASAYILQQVIEIQGGYSLLDSPPRTLSARPHRPAYGSDGDYWSKPNVEGVFEAAYEIMHEADPAGFPIFYR